MAPFWPANDASRTSARIYRRHFKRWLTSRLIANDLICAAILTNFATLFVDSIDTLVFGSTASSSCSRRHMHRFTCVVRHPPPPPGDSRTPKSDIPGVFVLLDAWQLSYRTLPPSPPPPPPPPHTHTRQTWHYYYSIDFLQSRLLRIHGLLPPEFTFMDVTVNKKEGAWLAQLTVLSFVHRVKPTSLIQPARCGLTLIRGPFSMQSFIITMPAHPKQTSQ